MGYLFLATVVGSDQLHRTLDSLTVKLQQHAAGAKAFKCFT